MPTLDTTSKLLLPLFLPIFLLDLILSLLSKLLASSPASTKNANIMQSVPVGDAAETHGAPRRSPNAPEKLASIYKNCTTVYEMVKQATEGEYGDKVAMQHFEFLGLSKLKPADRFPTKQFSEKLVQVTYQQLGQKIRTFGEGLRQMGMEPQPSTAGSNFDKAKGKFTLVIFEETCKEWTTALQGAMSQSMVMATCYATLGADAVVLAVNETQATALMVNWKQVEAFYQRAKDMPSLTTIIGSKNEMAPDGSSVIWRPPTGEKAKVQVVSFDDVMDMGKENKYDPTPPKPSDVAVIMYTSGSTGQPKGVVMKHSHLVAGIAGMATNVDLREGQETFVSYLPLAHILALQIENAMLSVGATLCYTDPRQLPKVMPKFQPTIFAGVPKVWELLQGGLEKKMAQGPTALNIVFSILLSWKMKMLSNHMDTPVSNLFFGIICSKVFGRRRIRFGVTGGGPMSASLQLFCRAVFNSPIIQGYALTETCVGGCFQATTDQRPGIVGPPVPCVEIVLQSEPEFTDSDGFSYLHTDTKGSKGEPVIGRGEICMRGPCISSGYYKLPGKTKEDFDEEGFFHTGDIGQFTADGCIQIVDRKKNLVKLKGGEYVAVEAMETAFATSAYCVTLCVIANGDLDGPLAIVLVNKHTLESWAKNAGISFSSVHELSHNKDARQEVVKSFVAAGKEAGLGKLELRIKDCALITDTEWTPGHGMTASMKLDRKQILSIHKEELENMYKRNGVTISS